MTRLDFAITCLNFTYSVFIRAVLIKILVLDIYNNQIMYNSGLRVIIVICQLWVKSIHVLMAHRVWHNLKKNTFGIIIVGYLYSQNNPITISYFSNVPTVVLESRAKSRMLSGRKRTSQEEDRLLIHQELNPAW